MRHLIESAATLTEATAEEINQMREYIRTLTQAMEMYPDMADEIEPRLTRLRAFVQNASNQRTQGDPNDPRTAPSQERPAQANPGQPNTVPDASDLRSPARVGAEATQQQSNILRRINPNDYPMPGEPLSQTDVDRLAARESSDNNAEAINEEVSISGSPEELIRMMQLAGANDAKPVDDKMINQPEHPTSCGCSSCAAKKSSTDMGDYIRMISSEEEEHDGDFDDATTELDPEYMNDVSASIPAGNDLNRKKGSHPPTNGGDNPMALEDEIRAKLAASLGEKMKSNDAEVSEDDDPCWDGYEMIGMKKKGGKEVPNCVPKK